MACVVAVSMLAAAFAPPTAHRHAGTGVALVTPRATIPHANMPSSATSIKPMEDYVLLDMQSVPDQTDTGIFLPTVYYDFQEKNEEVFLKPEPRAGTVVSVGPGRMCGNGSKRMPMPALVPGQRVVAGAGLGEKVVLDGQSAQEATHFLFRIDECAPRHLTSPQKAYFTLCYRH